MKSQLGLSRTVFLIEQEPLVSMWIKEALAAHGLETLPQARLVDVIKAARADPPAAVILDLASADVGADPNTRMGADHILRVLRQTYPDLCVVALAGHAGTKQQMLLQEFRVPVLTKPFASADLLRILGDHGVIAVPARSLEAMY
ncbi:DNA-binding transcriptional response regulator [Peristeroidobacter soli]|jgi:CheY-like chemotaxis protein|uniref:hypothetical protein n=1 Tax=Peristeroidobacter soli TaxID=2497877 RepID=UPI00101D0793|nr:hypothetical protein [Peristeroidobacter soli]